MEEKVRELFLVFSKTFNLDFSQLKDSKNLLAFSHGVDSTALFYLLLSSNIPFDLAFVNYKIRAQSEEEEKAAKALAKKYNKDIFTLEAPRIKDNFQAKAREIRHNFFKEICEEYKYNYLITAHQLNDVLEWFLMQFLKGSGLSNLLGDNDFINDMSFKKISPLKHIAREDLEDLLLNSKLEFFIDESNASLNYSRNEIRHKISNDLIKAHKNGIKNSFIFLEKDLVDLNIKIKALFKKELLMFKDIKAADKALKYLGYLMSQKQREELLKSLENSEAAELGGRFCICKYEKHFLAFKKPFKAALEKPQKELFRKEKIPKNLRALLLQLAQKKDLDLNELVENIKKSCSQNEL